MREHLSSNNIGYYFHLFLLNLDLLAIMLIQSYQQDKAMNRSGRQTSLADGTTIRK